MTTTQSGNPIDAISAVPADPLDRIEDRHAAAAFRRLVRHLRHRHDAENIDLMGLAGFCRNCLADWLVEAGAPLDKVASSDTNLTATNTMATVRPTAAGLIFFERVAMNVPDCQKIIFDYSCCGPRTV